MTRPKTPGRVKPLDQKLAAGGPRKVAPPDAADVIRQATATGSTKTGVAMALGCCVDVLNRWLDEDPELQEAFSQGRERERQTLHSRVYETAMGTGKEALIAAFFLLKARHGYREGEQESQANRVAITFNLPGALKPEQFTIDQNDTDTRAPVKRLPKPRIERS